MRQFTVRRFPSAKERVSSSPILNIRKTRDIPPNYLVKVNRDKEGVSLSRDLKISLATISEIENDDQYVDDFVEHVKVVKDQKSHSTTLELCANQEIIGNKYNNHIEGFVNITTVQDKTEITSELRERLPSNNPIDRADSKSINSDNSNPNDLDLKTLDNQPQIFCRCSCFELLKPCFNKMLKLIKKSKINIVEFPCKPSPEFNVSGSIALDNSRNNNNEIEV